MAENSNGGLNWQILLTINRALKMTLVKIILQLSNTERTGYTSRWQEKYVLLEFE